MNRLVSDSAFAAAGLEVAGNAPPLRVKCRPARVLEGVNRGVEARGKESGISDPTLETTIPTRRSLMGDAGRNLTGCGATATSWMQCS